MLLRLGCCLVMGFGVLGAVPAFGDGPPGPAMFQQAAAGQTPGSSASLFDDRLAFVQHVYQLDDGQLSQFRPVLEQLASEQRSYERNINLTLHRLQLAITILAADESVYAGDRSGAMMKLQRQIRTLHAQAPLALVNVMQRVERMVAKEPVEASRARLKAELAARLKLDPATVNVEEIDYLLAPLVDLVELPRTVLPGPSTPAAPLDPDATASQAPARPVERSPVAPVAPPTGEATPQPSPSAQVKSVPVLPPPGPAPVVAPRPVPIALPAAPAESEWEQRATGIQDTHGFTEQQRAVVAKVIKSVQDRAAAHREKRKADFEQAATLSGEEKERQLRGLNRRLDELYDELIRRTEAIATLEQRARVRGETPPAKQPAAPVLPTTAVSQGGSGPGQTPGTQAPAASASPTGAKPAPTKAPPSPSASDQQED